MAISHINEFFATVGGPAALGAVLDQVVNRDHREAVAMYVFGFQNRSFPDFERNLIVSLMSPFLKSNGKLRLWAVYVASIIITFAILVATNWDSETMGLVSVAAYAFLLAVAWSIATFPLDLFSYWITKKLLIDRKPRFPVSILVVMSDIFLSMSPYLLLVVVFRFASETVVAVFSTFLSPTTETAVGLFFVFLVLLMSAIISAAISIVQIVVLVVSLCIRGVVGFTQFNNVLAMHSRIHNFPFTFIGLITGLILFGAGLL